MISQTAEYALRTVAYLAMPQSTDLQTRRQIAAATQIPAAYLTKVLAALGVGGIVHMRRGPGGGYWLTRPPEELTVYDVVSALEALPRITHCPLGLPAHSRLCPLHSKLDQLALMIENEMRSTTIRELLEVDPASVRLCQFPKR